MEDVDMEIPQTRGHRHSRLIVWLGGMGQGDLSQSTKIKIQRLYTLLRGFSSFYSQHASLKGNSAHEKGGVCALT